MLDRRSVLTSTVAATLTAGLSTSSLGQPTEPPRRKIRVGALNVGQMTFWPIWAEILSPKGAFGTSFLNMEITHCWDVDRKLAEKFADKYDCQPVANYDAMVGRVDAIAFGGLYEVPWQHRLARPYVDAGIPTYLSRPFSYRLRDIDSILELAAKRGTPLMATSCQEHLYQATELKKRLSNCGVIKAAHGICSSNEYPGHFHIQWFILKALGYEVDTVSLLTDDELKASYLQETMLFRGGDGQPPYLASLHGVGGSHTLYLKVMGDQGTETITMDRSPDRTEELYSYFAPQLVDMQRTFEGNSYQPFDVIRSKTHAFLAGYYSHLEKGGSLVRLDSVPTDWSPRHFKPSWIDESIFKA
jgi:predicted dehydrogenase